MAMWFVAAAVLAFLPGCANANAGHSGCPCLTSFPSTWASEWVVNGSCQLMSSAKYTGSTSEPDYCYAATYGLSNCQTWDSGLPPFCSQSVPPGWCSDQWCYVNISSCTATDATPGVRGITGVANSIDVPYYSYMTCGVQSDFAKYQRAALKSAREIVDIVAAYVAEMRDFIERQTATLNSAETGSCPGFVDSCSCGQCTVGQGTWQSAPGVTTPGYSVDFRSLSVTHYDGSARSSKTTAEKRAQCLSQLVQSKFKQIARLEYNNPSRMAFLQYGDQGSAVYFSWPGISWCPSKFDPRFRPWYVSAVSGPKDVVIVMDRSGSMRLQNRWSQAQAAAKEVLSTLTSFDFANIVMFSDSASTFQSTNELQEVTQTNLDSMKIWIDDQIPAGGTNFRAGLQKAFTILSRSSAPSSSSGCNKLILFLTDGQDTSSLTMHELKSLNTNGVSIFTYSFGASADKARPKEIACQNNGIWYHVNDGADIGQVMSGYYMYYAGALARTKQIRWTMYKELTTQNDLITGCLPSYDRTVTPPLLLGVVCMDVSIIMDISTFRSKPDYTDAWNSMTSAASTCNMVRHDAATLESLRAAVAAESACLSTAASAANQAYSTRGWWLSVAALLATALSGAGARR